MINRGIKGIGSHCHRCTNCLDFQPDMILFKSGARRGSVQLGLSRQPSLRIKNKNGAMEGDLLMESAYESLVELEAKQKEMEEKHNQVLKPAVNLFF